MIFDIIYMDSKIVLRVAKIIIWIAGLYASTIYSFHTLYFIFSGFYFMFTNLGKRQQGTLSAYSVFNDNFQRLAGTMDGSTLFKNNGQQQQPELPLFNRKKEKVEDLTQEQQKTKSQYFRNESKYGNKPCFCGSQLKFKKCCLVAQRKRVQQQRLKRIKSV